MKGSEKQIEWANKIKDNLKKIYQDCLDEVNGYKEYVMPKEEIEQWEEAQKYYHLVMEIDDANFWIENRVFVSLRFDTKKLYSKWKGV